MCLDMHGVPISQIYVLRNAEILTQKIFFETNIKPYVPPQLYANMATFFCWQHCTGGSWGGSRGQFLAQNTRILSLRSQFWTTFWANWPGFIDVSGYAFGGILANWRHIFQSVVLIILLSLLLYCAFLDQFKFFHFICFIFQISFQISKQNWP